MNTFSWLLISDLHLKSTHTTWSQNVVLRDMVRDIEQRRGDLTNIRFVIVSGDLAHGGKPEQYVLVERFLDDLIKVLGLDRTDIFMVPGNHDIDRDQCALAFHGTRAEFNNAENVEKYLSNDNERNLLLQRLSGFSAFEKRYSSGLSRISTSDGLAYFSKRQIGDIPIGIVGLNSAFACGNDQDERNVVLGDRPIIDICEIIREEDVRLVIGVLHHPPSWLREFDQRTFNDRFLPMCDVIHRGHLHEPEVGLLYTSLNTQCLAIAAGAGYVWRQFKNSYSIVCFDPAAARCSASYFEYENHSGKFVAKASEARPLPLRGSIPGGAPELCVSIAEFGGNANRFAPYLSALILRLVTEVPTPFNERIVFASPEVATSAGDNTYVIALQHFLNVRNSLLAFASTMPLNKRVMRCKTPIVDFANIIAGFSESDRTFSEELSRRLSSTAEFCQQSVNSESSFIATMQQFAMEGDWHGLEEIARRYATNADPMVRHSARSHLCLALANSEYAEHHSEAKTITDELATSDNSSVDDFHLCFQVNYKLRDDRRAEVAIRETIARFGLISGSFLTNARRFVIASGNHELRLLLDAGTGGSDE
jgi:predicted MPP superfamily phosphohydrolase